MKDNPNKILSSLQIAQHCGIAVIQARRAGYQLGREVGTGVTQVGRYSWRYTPPEENRTINLVKTEDKGKGAFIAVDQYGSSYLVKPL